MKFSRQATLLAINLLLQVVVVVKVVVAGGRSERGEPHQHLHDIHRPKFELKFQNELDNSTIIVKEPEQQQIFKCQVKLAPLLGPQHSQPAVSSSSKQWWMSDGPLNSSWSIADWTGLQESQTAPPNNKWPSLLEATLAIDWLKDGQPLEESSVINVTLRGGQKLDKMKQQQQQQHPSLSAAHKRPRVEIKNTANNQQFKLTSRLRLAKLRLADSGRYKCLARATYKQISSSTSNNQEENKLLSVDQSLDSNGAFLMIATRASNGE